MSEMIERVAGELLRLFPLTDAQARKVATSVIMAMREPTEAMVNNVGGYWEPDVVWRAMISAALPPSELEEPK